MPHQFAPEPVILPQPYPPTVDARIYAFSKFTSQQGGPGLMVSASAEGEIEKMLVSFAIPSHAAICLHLANQAHIKSASVNLGELVVKSPKSNQVASDKIGWLYNFFEQRFPYPVIQKHRRDQSQHSYISALAVKTNKQLSDDAHTT
jgi:hypothetical protein